MGFALLLATSLATAFIVTMLVFRAVKAKGRRIERPGKPLVWDRPIEHG